MELEEGECSEDIGSSGEDETNDTELVTMETGGDDKEMNEAVLTSLQEQMQSKVLKQTPNTSFFCGQLFYRILERSVV